MNYTYDREKAKEAVLYIVSKVQNSDLHSVFKALYFAEKKHIAEYGRSITGDKFIAMDYGPVPSAIYDHCKESKKSEVPFEEAFIQQGWNIVAVRNHNSDFFSESDLECLDHGIEKVSGLGFEARKKLSHDTAWENAYENGVINPFDMAKDEGADEGTLEYIHDILKVVNL
jgi:uncharacterized phage-associated protein